MPFQKSLLEQGYTVILGRILIGCHEKYPTNHDASQSRCKNEQTTISAGKRCDRLSRWREIFLDQSLGIVQQHQGNTELLSVDEKL